MDVNALPPKGGSFLVLQPENPSRLSSFKNVDQINKYYRSTSFFRFVPDRIC